MIVSTAAGFEPTRECPIAFRVQLLNHSDKQPTVLFPNYIYIYYTYKLYTCTSFLFEIPSNTTEIKNIFLLPNRKYCLHIIWFK